MRLSRKSAKVRAKPPDNRPAHFFFCRLACSFLSHGARSSVSFRREGGSGHAQRNSSPRDCAEKLRQAIPREAVESSNKYYKSEHLCRYLKLCTAVHPIQSSVSPLQCAEAWTPSSCHQAPAQCLASSRKPCWLARSCLADTARGWRCCRLKNLDPPPADGSEFISRPRYTWKACWFGSTNAANKFRKNWFCRLSSIISCLGGSTAIRCYLIIAIMLS